MAVIGDKDSGRQALYHLCCYREIALKIDKNHKRHVGMLSVRSEKEGEKDRDIAYELIDIPSAEERVGVFTSNSLSSCYEGTSMHETDVISPLPPPSLSFLSFAFSFSLPLFYHFLTSAPDLSLIILCYSVKSSRTRQSILFKHLPEIQELASTVPVMLVGCKIDGRMAMVGESERGREREREKERKKERRKKHPLARGRLN